MAILLGLLAAIAYGTSDFGNGVASRRYDAGPVAATATALSLLCAALALVLFPGVGPRAGALEWGALSGLGGGAGGLALYRGFAAGRMTVVATLSAVLTAVVPVIVGVALGNRLGAAAVVGIVIAVPAIALVSWQPGVGDRATGGGAIHGLVAGLGFALLFIALDRAGTRSGAWPLVPGQAVSVALIAPFAVSGCRRIGRPPSRRVAALMACSGIVSGMASLLFLAATGHGELAVVAVVTALYPAFTVLLARLFLAEHWTRAQVLGLVVSAAAIVLVSAG